MKPERFTVKLERSSRRAFAVGIAELAVLVWLTILYSSGQDMDNIIRVWGSTITLSLVAFLASLFLLHWLDWPRFRLEE